MTAARGVAAAALWGLGDSGGTGRHAVDGACKAEPPQASETLAMQRVFALPCVWGGSLRMVRMGHKGMDTVATRRVAWLVGVKNGRVSRPGVCI